MLGYSQSILAHVALDYPQGGETFIEGQTVTIRWHIVAAHVTLNWDLYFSFDGGNNWMPIQLDIPLDSLQYTWTVPSIATSQGRVRIIQDNATQDYLDISMDFSIVLNTSPPSLDAPAIDTIIECNAGNQEVALQSWLDNHGGALASNHCGQLSWTNDFFQLTNNCGNSGESIVTFTATDECGSTYSVASVYIIDSTPPIIDVDPMSIVVECDGHGNVPELNAWLANHGGAHATDACGSVVWTNDVSLLLQQCGATGSSLVSFIATDECGNSALSTASFAIADHTAPEMNSNAEDLIIDCGPSTEPVIQLWLDLHGGAQATDLCGSVHWTHDYSTLTYSCGSAGTAIVTFIAADDCGNSSTTMAMLSIEDHLPPIMIQSAHDNTISCGAFNPEGLIQGWIDMRGGAEATDVCGTVSWTNDYSGLSDECGITGTANVIFTASDECGNSTSTTAKITIIDTIAPVIDNEARDTVIACGLPDQQMIIQQWLDQHGGTSASDACGDITWLDDFPSVVDNCDTTVRYDVRFTVVDECGNRNFSNASFTIMGGTSANETNSTEAEVNVYPNPTNNIITIDLGKRNSSIVYLSLVSTDGKLLWSGRTNDLISIPMSDYASGVYFLRIGMKNITYMKAVIKGWMFF